MFCKTRSSWRWFRKKYKLLITVVERRVQRPTKVNFRIIQNLTLSCRSNSWSLKTTIWMGTWTRTQQSTNVHLSRLEWLPETVKNCHSRSRTIQAKSNRITNSLHSNQVDWITWTSSPSKLTWCSRMWMLHPPTLTKRQKNLNPKLWYNNSSLWAVLAIWVVTPRIWWPCRTSALKMAAMRPMISSQRFNTHRMLPCIVGRNNRKCHRKKVFSRWRLWKKRMKMATGS